MDESPFENSEVPLDPAVTPMLFRKWRSPRFGRSNPERFNNPVWEWLIRSEVSAYTANERLKGPSANQTGPGWCFSRFGQSSTTLADGRVVLIGGEHEDFYDPDFYIYNDVVVKHPDGRMDVFGYPRDAFPPTDFHSATLVGREIVIVGAAGYPADRRPQQTPVFVLDLETFSIRGVTSSGTPPGWIYKHRAQLSDDGESLLISGGNLSPGDNRSHPENIDDWRLRWADWHWEQLTDRRWQRWELIRADKGPLHLWQYQQVMWDRRRSREAAAYDELTHELGTQPDLERYAELFRPPIPHEASADDEFRVVRIRVEGVTVRYVEDSYFLQMTVEGNLLPATIDSLVADLQSKLERLENSRIERRQL